MSKKKKSKKGKNKGKKRAGAKKGAKKKPNQKVKKKKQKCPQIRLVELVEVVTRGTAEAPVKGVAKAPTKKTPLQGANKVVVRPAKKSARQYINLPRNVDGQEKPHYGRYIELRARVKWKDKKMQGQPLTGKTVHFSCTRTNGKGRPAQIYNDGKESFGSGGDKTTAQTDAKGWTSVVKFNLSRFGGDKFKIAAQADEDGKGKKGSKKKTGNYMVWRKLYYKVTCMKRHDGTNYSNRVSESKLKKKYKNLFIEIKRTGNIKIADWSSVIEKGDARTWVDNKSGGAAGARTISFGLIDTLVKGAPIEIERTYNPASTSFTDDFSGYAFDLSAQNKWLVSVKYYDKNAAPPVWHNIPNGKVSLNLVGVKHKLKIDLSSIVTPTLPVNQLRLKVKLKKRKELSGVSSGPATIVGMRWRENSYPAKKTSATLHTMLHEAGHFLGLAPTKLPDAAGSNNPNWYNNPGVGNHCKYNTNKCIMYHSFRMTLSFCPNCSQSLKARDLTSPKVSATSNY